LADAATSTNVAGKTVVVTSPQVVTTAIVWPTDRTLEFKTGGYVTFTGAGALTGLKEVRPQWFGAKGDGTTNDTAAIKAALAAGAVVDFGSDSYRIARTTGTNDRWGLNVIKSGQILRGTGATFRRFNTDISTYALAYPLILIGTPDSNTASATEHVTIEGDITFIGEDVRHNSAGDSMHDGRYAIELKNTKYSTIGSGVKFTKIDSSAIYYQKPGEYDYANSTEYNTTKNYVALIKDCRFLATPHSVVGRALIHAVSIDASVDGFKSRNNYFEWCDDAISGGTTYDEYSDNEDNVYASGTVMGNLRRSGRGWSIQGDQIFNSSEHALYLGGMDMVVDVNIWTDKPAICLGDVKIYGRNVKLSGTVAGGTGSALEIYMTATDVTSTMALSSMGDSFGGMVDIATAGGSGLSFFITSRPWFRSFRPMNNIDIGGTLTLSPAAQTNISAVRIYTAASDANFPEGQIRGVKISAQIKNHRVGVFLYGNLARNILINGSTFEAKAFTSSGFNGSTGLNTRAAVMVHSSNTYTLEHVEFSNNIVNGSEYLFATDDGAGTSVYIPKISNNNRLDYIKNFTTTDMRLPDHLASFTGNQGDYFLDRTRWIGPFAMGNKLGDVTGTINSYKKFNIEYNGTNVLFYTDDSGTTKQLN